MGRAIRRGPGLGLGRSVVIGEKDVSLLFPAMSSSIALGGLVGWMLVLTVKHVIADFVLQNAWMAMGKDQKTGWALPLLAHCAIHGVLATVLIAAVQPKLWFLGLVDFAIHITIDRAKGLCVSHLKITQGHRWFWWLIGIDQALHHLTDFFFAIFIVANS